MANKIYAVCGRDTKEYLRKEIVCSKVIVRKIYLTQEEAVKAMDKETKNRLVANLVDFHCMEIPSGNRVHEIKTFPCPGKKFIFEEEGANLEDVKKQVLYRCLSNFNVFWMEIEKPEEQEKALNENAMLSDAFSIVMAEYSSTMSLEEAVSEMLLNQVRTDEMVQMLTGEKPVETNKNNKKKEKKEMKKRVTKETLRKELEKKGVIMKNTEFRKIKKEELEKKLEEVMNPAVEEVVVVKEERTTREKLSEYGVTFTDERFKKIPEKDIKTILKLVLKSEGIVVEEENVEEPTTVPETASIPVIEDFIEEIEKEQEEKANESASAKEVVEEPVKENTASKKEKTDKMFATIKEYANNSEAKGFGYTISPFMLMAAIMKADKDVKKLKDYNMTEADKDMCKEILKFLLKKGLIKPVVYSVQEDENVRVYTNEYTGRTTTSCKMIPVNKSKAYTAKKVTSYAVCFGKDNKEEQKGGGSTAGSSPSSDSKKQSEKGVLNMFKDKYEKVLSGEISNIDEIKKLVQIMYKTVCTIKDKNIVEDIHLMLADLGLRLVDAA